MKNRAEMGGSAKMYCGVSEGRFPCLEICCEVRRGAFGPEYRGICPHCSAVTLPPDSSTLQIATLFECSRLGYGRRMTDAKPPEQKNIKKMEGKSE